MRVPRAFFVDEVDERSLARWERPAWVGVGEGEFGDGDAGGGGGPGFGFGGAGHCRSGYNNIGYGGGGIEL